jgi:glycosyltransferase involved in cell wall biosynthesis
VTDQADQGVSPTFSVVICAYSLDRWSDLREAIASLQNQSVAPLETIVVIDHNDELLNLVRTTFPEIMAIPNQGTRGLSGARNTGVAAASGDVVAFLDDDARADPGWLARFREHYRQPDVLGVGGAVLPDWAGGRKPAWFPTEFLWVVGCSYRGQPTHLQPVRNLIGANMSYRRDALRAAGPFREGIGRVGLRPMGCEETELGIRVLNAFPGEHVLYDPEAVVWHRVPRSRMGPRYFLDRCFSEGLSKALVVQLVGQQSGLSSERAYTFRVLPKGVLRGLRAGVMGHIGGFGRAIAIVAGLAATTLGYVIGRLRPQTLPE